MAAEQSAIEKAIIGQGKRIVRVDKEGVTYLPIESVNLPQLTKDFKARVGVAIVGAGVLACGAANILSNLVLYCDSQKDIWGLAAGARFSTLECVAKAVPYAFGHIFK